MNRNVITEPNKLIMKLLPPNRLKPGIRYVPSQFAMPFEHGGKKYVFNTLTRHCLEADLPESCGAGEGYDDLIDALLLVPEGKDECKFYESLSNMIRIYYRKKGERSYIILPTLGCNARCIYCYEEGAKPVTMTPETADQTVRYILNSHAGDKVKMNWFGGEPLLGVNIIDRICEGLRKEGVPYRSGMVSNGSLITETILEKMTAFWNLENIQISMDGRESDYISRKKYLNGSGQYHTVLRNIERMAEKGIRVMVRCNVDWENLAGVPNFLEDMKRYVGHKEKVSIYLSPLFSVRAGEGAPDFWDRMLDALSLIEEAGFRTGNIIGFSKNLKVNFCLADGGGVVICPDGVLSPCEHLQQAAKFGDVWHGTTDEEARREFCRTDRTREKCRKCPFLPECSSFASCPIVDYDCREMRRIIIGHEMGRLVDRKEENNTADEEELIC